MSGWEGAQACGLARDVIAVSDTLTRLILGPVADIVSPVPTYSENGIWAFPRKPYVTRMIFVAGAALVFALAFIWPIVGVRSQEALWPLRSVPLQDIWRMSN